ncbi:hypothetical protein CGGC5_v017138 [Colletotrichum fructicola Nara gc5]|uniref:Uncharacterized protein n=1 Tax=Colletotrichum fructicola (strain Nara gc5) TaxID=1213859 RepID=A0A7J6IEM8_COLFN|nr:hypothetical protein CGGC5_v017138 [Colletotrichum fructicola Nara gc5]
MSPALGGLQDLRARARDEAARTTTFRLPHPLAPRSVDHTIEHRAPIQPTNDQKGSAILNCQSRGRYCDLKVERFIEG